MKALISCLAEVLIPFVCGISVIHQREDGHFLAEWTILIVPQRRLPHYPEENTHSWNLSEENTQSFQSWKGPVGAPSFQAQLGCLLLWEAFSSPSLGFSNILCSTLACWAILWCGTYHITS